MSCCNVHLIYSVASLSCFFFRDLKDHKLKIKKMYFHGNKTVP
jgi:hypothetical protein